HRPEQVCPSVVCYTAHSGDESHVTDCGGARYNKGSMTDEALVARAVEGDVDAYAALAERYYASCARMARRMLRNDADAEDVVQETFLRAFRAIRGFERGREFRVWLFTILVNQCRTAAPVESDVNSAFLMTK